jgi:5'-methylthioadenosine phosphorylase
MANEVQRYWGWSPVLGIVGGTSLLYSELPRMKKERVHTPYGSADLLCGAGTIMILRHQGGAPPHRINNCAQMAALAIKGTDRVISIGSAGSLRPDILPGSLFIPTDYISFATIPSIHDHAIDHICPKLDSGLLKRLHDLVPQAAYGGVYAQTRGPRIETRAEVRALSKVADVVGMTLASEATLAQELGMPFAALCTVDNAAHGLDGQVLTYEHLLEMSRTHSQRTGAIVRQMIEELA